jgi:dihydrofolate reductase
MSKLRVHSLSMSLDGYVAGPDQSLEEPLGVGGEQLHEWIFTTAGGREMMGKEGGSTGVDDRIWAEGFDGIGAWIMGRNMFGPIRDDWGDSEWSGWWGDEPPYHCDVFVLTNHARDPLAMAGGTTFHFVTDGIEAALDRAREAAGDQDVRLGGGAAAVQQYLAAGLIDQMDLAVTPVLLGGGARLFADGVVPAGYEVAHLVAGEADVVHARITRTA